ncbi:MAG TPA: hypothetical protein VHT34_03630 [Clostridia bacterium]|nr:hypothetical protein [Clostridia bacterium]
MIKVIYGKKGMGKTKVLVDSANKLASEGSGAVVFIDYSNQLMYDLKRDIRFINVSEFPVDCSKAFLGFLCGLVAENYDIDGIFIDGLTYIIKENAEGLEDFFAALSEIAKKYNIKFYMSINGNEGAAPEYLKEYLV